MAAIYEPKGMAREYAALACNLYRGCLHGCTYCYAPACLRMASEVFWATSVPRKGILRDLQREALRYAQQSEPVLFCFTSDPYQPNEDGTTGEALRIMAQAGCPFQVLTKGGTRALRDLALFHQVGAAFGTTLLFTDDRDRREWEPNAASVDDRVAAIAAFHEAGVRTWVSIEPVIDPDQAVELVGQLAPIVDEFKVGKLNHHQHAATVDWYAFTTRVVAALQASGRDYMLKDALHPYLPKGAPTKRHETRLRPGLPTRHLAL